MGDGPNLLVCRLQNVLEIEEIKILFVLHFSNYILLTNLQLLRT